MTPAVATVAAHLSAIGYVAEAVLADYSFADVLSPAGETRRVELAAFTQTPPSYRTAAFAVVEAGSGESNLDDLRALGAPVIFSISGDVVELWQVHADQPPSRIAVTPANDLGVLFARHAEHWNPRAIHRAKAIDGVSTPGRQLDFVDLGLMVAIEGGFTLSSMRCCARRLQGSLMCGGAPRWTPAYCSKPLFRFLAAKILIDRGRESAAS
jgi:hypothetical protein